jgi:alpha-amylase/alpha-mannosidase (GH57 family)
MTRIHLLILWHMHQPQYRDPSSGRYVLPWTRLHALKDYFGMVKLLEEFPALRMTFNIVPALGRQLEEYVSGKFREPWFETAFTPAEQLDTAQKEEILLRAFQVNHENLMARWPRYVALYQQSRAAGPEAVTSFSLIDWRDLQTLSQLAWMDQEYLAHDPVVREISARGKNFTEENKAALREKQLELLARVLPEYRRASERGQIEISTTPFYHPILPLLCDSDVARESNPRSPLLTPPFQHPEDAREQLVRAHAWHEKVFGRAPAGLWPSEGSVSDAALAVAAELGFRWFATDEGVLGRTIGTGFGRDSAGIPGNADKLYSPWRIRVRSTTDDGGRSRSLVGFFRDHYISDLVGFVYGRMNQQAAAMDLHRRIRAIGERVVSAKPLVVSIILDGENAWEYFPGGGREFLRKFYGSIASDPEIRTVTASEAAAEAGDAPAVDHVVPGSWIQANFDVWAGHAEDLRAWELLREAREAYGQAVRLREQGNPGALSPEKLAMAYESLLAAEGSDWCWWYGPEHSSANDAEFDALYRTHLTEVYVALGRQAPEALAQPIKRAPEHALVVAATARLDVKVDGRETSYFEWIGAGLYSADRRAGAMHGRSYYLHELRYGFSEDQLFLRVDTLPGALEHVREFEFHAHVITRDDLLVIARVREGALAEFTVERNSACLLSNAGLVAVAYGSILEISLARALFAEGLGDSLQISVALWHGGLPMDLLPGEGTLKVQLGEDAFAWSG